RPAVGHDVFPPWDTDPWAHGCVAEQHRLRHSRDAIMLGRKPRINCSVIIFATENDVAQQPAEQIGALELEIVRPRDRGVARITHDIDDLAQWSNERFKLVPLLMRAHHAKLGDPALAFQRHVVLACFTQKSANWAVEEFSHKAGKPGTTAFG